MTKTVQMVPLKVSTHWRYLYQDVRKTWLEISKMKSYGEYSRAIICIHMVKNTSDLVHDNEKKADHQNLRTGKRGTFYVKRKCCRKKWETSM